MYETRCQSRFDARYWMLGASALGRPRGMVLGGRILAMAKAKRIHIDGDGEDMSITLLEGGEEKIEIDE